MIHYYTLLNLTPNASLSEIKKAYRKQALLYHPDRNKHPDAIDLFLKIDEAYDYLVKLKTGKIHTWTAPIVNSKEQYEEKRKEQLLKIIKLEFFRDLEGLKDAKRFFNGLGVMINLISSAFITYKVLNLFNSFDFFAFVYIGIFALTRLLMSAIINLQIEKRENESRRVYREKKQSYVVLYGSLLQNIKPHA